MLFHKISVQYFFLLIFHSALKLILMYCAQRKSGLRNSNIVILDCFLSYKQVYFLIKNEFLKVLYHLLILHIS